VARLRDNHTFSFRQETRKLIIDEFVKAVFIKQQDSRYDGTSVGGKVKR
jgi:hypothetical protein